MTPRAHGPTNILVLAAYRLFTKETRLIVRANASALNEQQRVPLI